MVLSFNSELAYAGRELTRVRADLVHADATGLSQVAQLRERSATIRAYAYVWLAAVLERVVNDALRSVLTELTSLSLPSHAFRSSLFALLCHAELTSIAARNPNPAWDTRIQLLSRLTSPLPAAFNVDTLPLDGRTLKAEHFDRIWYVFGLSGPSLPAPKHGMALKDLAEGRNKVAHGNVDPISFGKSKTAADVLQLTHRVDEILVHVLTQFDDYVKQAKYAR